MIEKNCHLSAIISIHLCLYHCTNQVDNLLLWLHSSFNVPVVKDVNYCNKGKKQPNSQHQRKLTPHRITRCRELKQSSKEPISADAFLVRTVVIIVAIHSFVAINTFQWYFGCDLNESFPYKPPRFFGYLDEVEWIRWFNQISTTTSTGSATIMLGTSSNLTSTTNNLQSTSTRLVIRTRIRSSRCCMDVFMSEHPRFNLGAIYYFSRDHFMFIIFLPFLFVLFNIPWSSILGGACQFNTGLVSQCKIGKYQ